MILKKCGFIALLLTTALSSGCFKSDKNVSGMVRIDEELKAKIAPNAVLYIIVRQAGATSGPPVAVRRVSPPLKFPLQFTVDETNTMIPNTPFPEKVTLTARIAQNGSASPIRPGDIEGTGAPDPAWSGTKDVEIVLNRVR